LGGFLAPGVDLDGAAEFSEGVGLDEDFVLDGLVGMEGMIGPHGVGGGDDPVHGGDAAVGGADGEAVVAEGVLEAGTTPAGEAFSEFERILLEPGPDAVPGV
jgi:hypothetical protein